MFSDVVLALEHMAGMFPEMPLSVGLVCMFYGCVFYIGQFIDSRLQAYAQPMCMFREWVCVGVRMHVFWLGAIFSRNVWLNKFTKSTTGYFDFEVVCHSAALMSTLTCFAYRLWHAWQAAPRVRSVLLLCTSLGMWCAWRHNATPQVFLACYALDTFVRFLPFAALDRLLQGMREHRKTPYWECILMQDWRG
jgi:hypothetical protein